MRIHKVFLLILVGLFFFSFTSACDYQEEKIYLDSYHKPLQVHEDYYHSEDYWENQDRFPISDYKDGYTYRATKEYRENREKHYSYKDERKRQSSFYEKTNKVVYYEYVPYLRDYEEKTCYNSPPKGKLLYIKCDF
jgi:hypothetical protein